MEGPCLSFGSLLSIVWCSVELRVEARKLMLSVFEYFLISVNFKGINDIPFSYSRIHSLFLGRNVLEYTIHYLIRDSSVR